MQKERKKEKNNINDIRCCNVGAIIIGTQQSNIFNKKIEKIENSDHIEKYENLDPNFTHLYQAKF